MERKNLLSSPPEKVLLMYQAVVDMVGEGFDINTMKVSDITTRAGIGKGTAYEYFSSKEEIITHALAFDVLKKREELLLIAKKEESFRAKIERILDYIGEKFGEHQTFCMLFRIGTGSYEISESLKRECGKLKQDISGYQTEEIIANLMKQGVAEGIIKEQDVYRQGIALVAQATAFAACLAAKNAEKEIPVTVEQAKEFVYDSLVKSLN